MLHLLALTDPQLDPSEELGNVVHPHDVTLALSVYLRASVHKKAMACFAELGQIDKMLSYAKRIGFGPDWALLQLVVRLAPERAGVLAMQLTDPRRGVEAVPSIQRVSAVLSPSVCADAEMGRSWTCSWRETWFSPSRTSC